MVSWLAGCSDNSVKPETVAPSQPTNVTATQVDATTVDLTWTASTDNVCVAGYNVYRGDPLGAVLVGITPINSFRDTGLVPGPHHPRESLTYLLKELILFSIL